MLSPYRIPSNNKRREQETSNDDLRRPQMTAKEVSPAIENIESNTKKVSINKKIFKGGSLKENRDINDEYLDEILHKTIL